MVSRSTACGACCKAKKNVWSSAWLPSVADGSNDDDVPGARSVYFSNLGLGGLFIFKEDSDDDDDDDDHDGGDSDCDRVSPSLSLFTDKPTVCTAASRASFCGGVLPRGLVYYAP
ncbi:unnamed protein product [Soboliphyme baturini]|uniref:Secreted protein n=1 Tax=Soboliphyme baturini TaxID=241478 RepID=A0A183IP32_9BILA|nr:unnamed protein product [Soboliphyme baturini]